MDIQLGKNFKGLHNHFQFHLCRICKVLKIPSEIWLKEKSEDVDMSCYLIIKRTRHLCQFEKRTDWLGSKKQIWRDKELGNCRE